MNLPQNVYYYALHKLGNPVSYRYDVGPMMGAWVQANLTWLRTALGLSSKP